MGNFVYVTFYLPKGLWLVNKGKCSVQLKGTKPVTVMVGATCTTLYGLKKFSVITPKITNPLQSEFWGLFGLPTIWVCISDIVSLQVFHYHPRPHSPPRHLYRGEVFFFVKNS